MVVSEPLGNTGSIGVRIRISELAKALTRKGVSVQILNPYGSIFSKTIDKSITSFPISGIFPVAKAKLFGVAHRSLQSNVGRYFLLNKFTVEKTSRFFANKIIAALREKEVSLLQGEQDLAGLACVRAKQQLNLPVITDLHGIWVQEMGLNNQNSNHRSVLLDIVSETVRQSDVVLVVSEKMKNYLTRTLGAKSTKIEILPNAAPLPTKVRVRRNKTPRILYVGSLEPIENVELYIRSVPYVRRKFPKANFYVVGHGRMKSYLERLCSKINAPVTFVQTLHHSDLIDMLCYSDVGVIPTTSKAAMPLKLFEYMSIGLPFVVSEGTECAEFVAEGNYGVVARPDPVSFGDSIAKLLRDQDFADSYSRRCLEAVREKYNWDVVCDKLMNIYQKVLSK